MSDVGSSKFGPMNIGEEAKPPFAVLPDPSSLFLNRSKRFASLACGNELAPYLEFLANLTRAQHEAAQESPQPALPPPQHIAQSLEHGMPPLSRSLLEPDEAVETAIDRVLDRLAGANVPSETSTAIKAVRSASHEERRTLAMAAILEDAATGDAAQQALVAAGLQVHLARLASQLAAGDLKPVGDSICPVCGSPPMTSSVVGWPGAHNTRFCTCSLCGTMWNVVRVKCLLCGATSGITYHTIEGKPETVKAETCGGCRGYVKILYQVNDHELEPLADDVATLGLDMLMAEEGWKRSGRNPFLIGY